MRFPVDGTQPIKLLILPDLPIFLEFTPKSILFTHQSWHITWFHNQCCRHEMICENFEIFENFLRILNFIKSVLTTEAVSPEAVLNSEPSKNTSEQLFFSTRPKSKRGSNLSSRTTKCSESFQSAEIRNNQLDWTRIPDFWKVYNFIYLFQGIETLWNNNNYWVNMQDCSHGIGVSFNFYSIYS